ncbi:hypothetical protein V4V35_12160 [Bacillus infantis]|uniref:hypothetical protein n=1 Tax=Bacillus infantis TaxID=324767 RepID=UPI002FBD368F
MLYTTQRNEMSQFNKQVELSVFLKEFSEIIEEIESEKAELEKLKVGVNFLNEAKKYAEGKESTSYEFSPSEAFIFTLKALDLSLIKNRDLPDAIQEIINGLNNITRGIYSNSDLVTGFFNQLTKVITHEKEKPTKLVSTII